MIVCALAMLSGAAELEPPDRSRPPEVLPPELLALPAPELHEIRPGLRVWHLPSQGMRDVEIRVTFRRGALDLAQAGSASYSGFSWIWDQATKGRSANEVEIFEDLNEVNVSTYSSLRNTTVSMSATVESWRVGLPLLHDVLTRPRFRRRDLGLVRDNRQRWYLVDAPTLGYAIIESGLDYAWYPDQHPFAAPPDLMGWHRLGRRAVRRHHQDLLRTAPVDVLVVGDVPWADLETALEPVLSGLGVPGSTEQPPLPFEPPSGTQVIAVDLGGTQRASVGLQLAAPLSTSDGYPTFVLIDHALGGSFLSRLNRELREERGLTYGISSTYLTGPSRGVVRVETEVAADNVGEAMRAIEEQLSTMAEQGLTEAEIGGGVAAALSTWNNTFSTVSSVDQRYWGWLGGGHDVAYGQSILGQLQRVDPAQSQTVAARWLSDDAARVWVVVGPRDVLEPQLSALKLDVSWVPSELVVLGLGVAPRD